MTDFTEADEWLKENLNKVTKEGELKILVQEIIMYCLENNVLGSYNNKYKEFLVSFNIKQNGENKCPT